MCRFTCPRARYKSSRTRRSQNAYVRGSIANLKMSDCVAGISFHTHTDPLGREGCNTIFTLLFCLVLASSSHLPCSTLDTMLCSPSASLQPAGANCTFSLCSAMENQYLSVQFSHSVMSDSLRPHGPQHTRLPCLSPTPGAYSNSCPLSWWCHPTSVVPFSSHFQSFTASESFPISQFFASSGQSIGVSASASVLPMNIQDWFPLGWTGWIPGSPRDSYESSPTPQFKSINSSALSFLYIPTLTSIHNHWKKP